jgi:hypothetical protein
MPAKTRTHQDWFSLALYCVIHSVGVLGCNGDELAAANQRNAACESETKAMRESLDAAGAELETLNRVLREREGAIEKLTMQLTKESPSAYFDYLLSIEGTDAWESQAQQFTQTFPAHSLTGRIAQKLMARKQEREAAKLVAEMANFSIPQIYAEIDRFQGKTIERTFQCMDPSVSTQMSRQVGLMASAAHVADYLDYEYELMCGSERAAFDVRLFVTAAQLKHLPAAVNRYRPVRTRAVVIGQLNSAVALSASEIL